MKAAIMQPYFLPYMGYYQLIATVDKFIIYDNIEYTKKGWVNRNRMLRNGMPATFSLPLKKDSDFLHVRDRVLAIDFDREKLLNQLRGAYLRAPYFDKVFPLLREVICYDEENLFRFLLYSVQQTCRYIGISTEIIVSSCIEIDHRLKNQEKVIALCNALGADVYINTMGGLDLYKKREFSKHDIELRFIQPKEFEYSQFGAPFVPWLSIIDVLMFNPVDRVQALTASGYDLN